MGLNLRILLLFIFVVISEAAAGFVQDNQNIFYGHSSDGFKSTPISYQSFVNYNKFPASDHNSFDGHSSSKPNAQSIILFKPADYAAKAAYQEEVENAHRVALDNRQNDTDAAYAEAYTEAIKAQRKAESVEVENRYTSHQLKNQFGFNPEYSSHSRLPEKSKSNHFQSSRYEDEDIVEYELRKSVEYIVPPNYKFNVNRVVRQQPQNIAETSEIQFSPATYGPSPDQL